MSNRFNLKQQRSAKLWKSGKPLRKANQMPDTNHRNRLRCLFHKSQPGTFECLYSTLGFPDSSVGSGVTQIPIRVPFSKVLLWISLTTLGVLSSYPHSLTNEDKFIPLLVHPLTSHTEIKGPATWEVCLGKKEVSHCGKKAVHRQTPTGVGDFLGQRKGTESIGGDSPRFGGREQRGRDVPSPPRKNGLLPLPPTLLLTVS